MFYRDKGFFFFSYEEMRLPIGDSRGPRTILLPDARRGIFTYIDNAGVRRQINIFDPRFSTGITGINPIIQSRILDRLPTQGNSIAGDSLNTTGFRFNQADDTMRHQFDTRIDIDINDRHSVSGVFVLVRDENLRPDADGTQGFDPTPIISNKSDNETLVLSYRATAGANFTNEVRGGYFDSRVPFARREQPPAFFLTLPLISNPEVSFLNQDRQSQNYNLQDNANYTWGDHSLRFGGLAQFVRVRSAGSSPDNSVPLFTVGSSLFTQITPAQFADPSLFPGGINATQRTRANSLLGLLGGIISSGVQSFNATSDGGFAPGLQKRQELAYDNYALYFQDQWRVSPRLTLNLGLRYELYTPVRDVNGSLLEVAIPEGTDPRDALLNPNGTIRFAGGNAGGNNLFRTDRNNFAPNVSFAYSPQFGNRFLGSLFPGDGRTVIRGGFSISYFNDEYIKGALTAAETTPGLQQTVSLPVLNARVDNVPAFPVPTVQI
ncbi:MAG: TonB-dependent receptor domain-containing protein, partial [Pyrinomonadaceae bacterium]